MPNIKNNMHNQKIANPPKDNVTRSCNCIRKHQCPLNEKCPTKRSITPNEENSKTKIYYGVTERAFKLRYANHKKSFNKINTKLTQNYQTNIGMLYQQSSKQCLLCLNEKLAIPLHGDDNMLNKRSEVISKCRQRNKYMLANYDSKD